MISAKVQAKNTTNFFVLGYHLVASSTVHLSRRPILESLADYRSCYKCDPMGGESSDSRSTETASRPKRRRSRPN